MYMVHNGHLAEPEWSLLKSLASPDVPALTLAPHVTASISNRSLPVAPDWVLPIYPFRPANPCFLNDLKAGRQCLRGFSVQGRIEKSRRNYTEVWEQIGGHRKHHTSSAASNFKLNILGELVEAFNVPGGRRRGLKLDSLHQGYMIWLLHKPGRLHSSFTPLGRVRPVCPQTPPPPPALQHPEQWKCATWCPSTRTRPTPSSTTSSPTALRSCRCSRARCTTRPSSAAPC